ncbi:hypothetical protein RvY_13615-2 [Ramazzottius varieornatus]|uniref:Uncharacterized protein n=1 Tax=Ramazzottius varieornatus TaxID=947166 RepID=A0A1D1VSI5_RAMVA|nr:hypothetical protein RvY_13615-2 [Ramazzottius varieornatus]
MTDSLVIYISFSCGRQEVRRWHHSVSPQMKRTCSLCQVAHVLIVPSRRCAPLKKMGQDYFPNWRTLSLLSAEKVRRLEKRSCSTRLPTSHVSCQTQGLVFGSILNQICRKDFVLFSILLRFCSFAKGIVTKEPPDVFLQVRIYHQSFCRI